MALGMLVAIENGIAKIFNHEGKWENIPAKRIPQGIKPGTDFNYSKSKNGYFSVRPPADHSTPQATNTAKDRQMYAIKRLMSPGHGPDGKGWSLAQASGIVGRAMIESFPHLKTDAKNPADPGTSEGLFQWNRDRKKAMQQFTAKYDNKLDGQIDFFDHEVVHSPSERLALVHLEQAKTPEEASRAMMHYERPGGYRPGAPEAGLGYRQTVRNASSLMSMFDPNYKPSVTADTGSADGGAGSAGMAPDEMGNTTIDPADTTIDAGNSEEDNTLGDTIAQAGADYANAGTPPDTSNSQAYINSMIQQGYQQSTQGGYLPRLPTIEETYGNV
jgi:hypothetical protein